MRNGVWNPTAFTVRDEENTGCLCRILVRLDGVSSSRDIARAEKIPEEVVEQLVDHLIDLGVVESEASTSLDYYLDHIIPSLGRGSAASGEELQPLLVGDSLLGGLIRDTLLASLPEHKIEALPPTAEAWLSLSKDPTQWLHDALVFQEVVDQFEFLRGKFVIFAQRVVDPLQLQAFNRIALRHKIPWMHAALDGPFILVGPTFLPLRFACYECFETRVTMNMREGASYLAYKRALCDREIRLGTLPIEPVLANLLAAHAASEAVNFLLTGSSFTLGKALAIYLPTMEFTYNEVLRVPSCSACCPTSEADDSELYFDVRSLIKAGSPMSTL